MRKTHSLLTVLLAALLVSGCQHGSLDNPLAPPSESERVQANHQATQATSSRILLGLWTIEVSADHASFTATPDRSLGMHLNATRLLEKTACTSCLSIGNVHVLPDNELSADLTLKHPFPGKDQYTAFDVRGILLGDTDYAFPLSGRKVAWGNGSLKLINADGYTPLFNPTEYPETGSGPALFKYITGKYSMGTGFTSTLNPYLAYSEDQPRRIFTAGSSQTRKALLHLPAGPLRFGYAVDGCWVPVVNVTDPLKDFPTTANCSEAYQIKVNMGSILPDAGSSAQVQVEVFDHQGKDTISSVTVEAPDLFSGELPLTYSSATGGESYLFEGTMVNALGAYIAKYPMLIRVVDSQTDPNLGGVDAWQVATVKVSPKQGWVRLWDSTNDGWLVTRAVTTDIDGNIYVAGAYGGMLDFDPGPGVDQHTSNGDYDAYLLKLDPEGVFQWARTWGGTGTDTAVDVAVDPSNNILVAGAFYEKCDLDPGNGVDEHSGPGAVPFISKFSSDGTYLWGLSRPGSSQINAVIADSSGNVYDTGYYSGDVDFDPGPGEDIQKNGGAYLCKYSPNGVYQWVRVWNAVATDLAALSGGRIYVTGWFKGTCDFDPGSGEAIYTSEFTWSDYLSRFSTNGEFAWVKVFGGSENQFDTNTPLLASDPWGYLYIAGGFDTKADFDPGPGVLQPVPQGLLDGFLTKFTSDGDLLWLDTWGGGGTAVADCWEVAVGGDGEPCVSGSFSQTVDFDPGPGKWEYQAGGSGDIFASRFHSDGSFMWAYSWTDDWGQLYSYVAADKTGNDFVTGEFSGGPIDFDPGPDTDYHSTPPDGGAFFITKMPPDGKW